MDQAPRVGLVVTRRPQYAAAALETAARLCDTTVYRFHESGTFSGVVNSALREAETLAPMVVKIDDHDFYPETYDLVEHWRPGIAVWGEVEVRGCDGSFLGRETSMCATVFSSSLILEPDRLGQLTASLCSQTVPVVVPSGVIKRICPGEWSWGARPGTLRGVNCTHGD